MTYNINNGYVGFSRSIRSEEAIADFEVPISLINKTFIEGFVNNCNTKYFDEIITQDDLDYLKAVSVVIWKYVAKYKVGESSWHHTSIYFNKTNHYNLYTIGDFLLKNKDTIDEEYKAYQESQKKEGTDVKYGVIKVQVWGGSRKRPKLEGYEEVAGIVIGDWLFYKNNHSVNGSISKYKTTANKVEWLKEYDSYADLTKNHKEYKNTKKVFNKLIFSKSN